MLRCNFKGLPGEQKVLQGQYILWNGISPEDQIDGEAWQQTVFPDSKVNMSIVMQRLGTTGSLCPRPGCDNTAVTKRGLNVHHCPVCHLIFIPQDPFHANSKRGDVEWPTAANIHSRILSGAATGQELPLSNVKTKKARRQFRESKVQKEAERELLELRVFRRIHISETSGGLQSEYISQKVQSSLSIIQKGVKAILYSDFTDTPGKKPDDEYGDSDDTPLSFETLYGEVSKMVLMKEGKVLYDNLVSMIPNYIEDIAEDPLVIALMGENDSVTLAEASFIWQDIWTVLGLLTDNFMYMVSRSRQSQRFNPWTKSTCRM